LRSGPFHDTNRRLVHSSASPRSSRDPEGIKGLRDACAPGSLDDDASPAQSPLFSARAGARPDAAMTITRAALILTALGVGVFLLLFAATLATILRRPVTSDSGVRPAVRLVWTLVPAALLAVLLGALILTGRMAL